MWSRANASVDHRSHQALPGFPTWVTFGPRLPLPCCASESLQIFCVHSSRNSFISTYNLFCNSCCTKSDSVQNFHFFSSQETAQCRSSCALKFIGNIEDWRTFSAGQRNQNLPKHCRRSISVCNLNNALYQGFPTGGTRTPKGYEIEHQGVRRSLSHRAAYISLIEQNFFGGY